MEIMFLEEWPGRLKYLETSFKASLSLLTNVRTEWILSVRFLCVYLCSAFKRLSIFLLNVLLLKLKFLICDLFPIERNKSGSGAFHRWSESFAFRTNVFGLLLSSSVLYIFLFNMDDFVNAMRKA